jgi:hypothetical protein
MAFLGNLQSAAPQWRNMQLAVESAYQIQNDRQVIVCQPEGNQVAIYFEAYNWLGADFTPILDMF